MNDNIKLPSIPKPHTPPVFATAANTPSVKAGYELGGYEKTPPLFDEHQLEAYAREAVRLNAQADIEMLNAENDRLMKLVIELRAEVVRLNAQAVPDSQEKALLQAIQERDAAEDYIDALLDEVLGTDRPEWSSVYGHADVIEQVRERMNTLMKPSIDKAWDRFQSSVAPAAPQPAQAVPDALSYVHPVPDHCDRVVWRNQYIHLAAQAQEAAPAQQPLTDAQCDAIYMALDNWAREFDEYEFGLPHSCGGGVEGGREIIRQAHGIGVKS